MSNRFVKPAPSPDVPAPVVAPEYRTMLYREDCPEGRVFVGEAQRTAAREEGWEDEPKWAVKSDWPVGPPPPAVMADTLTELMARVEKLETAVVALTESKGTTRRK